ncbi:MAG TPA: aldose 1-epimerase [Symbiobacteriaceae bacterium]|nr:aldose 1-epimerase [Symbiobacteriaceae bacterium]
MSRYTAVETLWSGIPAIRLADTEADTAALVVPSLGGNLISLTVKGEELLRTPPDAAALQEKPARWGIPVLMPPNRIEGGRFRFGGREYQLELTDSNGGNHIHGFPLRRPWQVVALGEGSVTIAFRSADHPDVLAQWPHPFVLSLTYTLRGQALHCKPVVSNEGPDPMPFGLGFHPYFLAPVGAQQEIRLTPSVAWEAENWLPTGRFRPAEGAYDLSVWQPVHAVARDVGYMLSAREPDGGSKFELADRETGRTITLKAAPAYGHWLVFNGFAGTISPEPYTCMTNAFNLNLPPETSGMAVLAGGATWADGDFEVTWDWD